MGNRNDDEIVLVLLAVGVPVLLLFLLSRWIGADFLSTVKMVGGLFLTALAVAGFHHLKSPGLVRLGSLFSVGAWLSFWPILGSWARGGLAADDPQAAYQFGEPQFWNGTMFKLVILFALIGFFVWLLRKDDY